MRCRVFPEGLVDRAGQQRQLAPAHQGRLWRRCHLSVLVDLELVDRSLQRLRIARLPERYRGYALYLSCARGVQGLKLAARAM